MQPLVVALLFATEPMNPLTAARLTVGRFKSSPLGKTCKLSLELTVNSSAEGIVYDATMPKSYELPWQS
jgi:hypothetical protein